jgi:acetate kinase
MDDVILVLNSGSSSIKFSVFVERDGQIALKFRGQVDGLYASPRFIAKDAAGNEMGVRNWGEGLRLGHEGAIAYLTEFLSSQSQENRLMAVGHRVVHGGHEFSSPTLVSEQVLAKLEKYIPLAPLHQPHNLVPIRLVNERRPELPQVACFDTAFHCTQEEVAQAFALPSSITKRGVRRYGFHGLSYEYIASVLPGYEPKAASGRVVIAHLGNGASMCALRGCKSVATTMSFTAADGLPMGTRCGSIDPGVILYLMDELNMDARAIEKLIYQDMRTLLKSADPAARFAVDLFIYRIGRELGSLAAACGGLDALVFTGGIGEHAAVIRERVCRNAAWLGLELDVAANEAGGPRISTRSSSTSAWVIPTNEELMIARHTRRVIGTSASAA